MTNDRAGDADKWAEFRYRASRISLISAAVAGVTVLMIALESASGQPMRDKLRLAYGSQPVVISTLHTAVGLDSCGYYRVGRNPTRLRYFNSEAGLWAEGLSTAWRSPDLYPTAAADLNDRWQHCMTYVHGRGGGLDFLFLPLTVAYLNAT